MKSLMLLLQHVFADASTWCCTSATKDMDYVLRRFEHEGLSFLTITLPSFCSAFERSLAQGWLDPALFSSFKRRGGLPQFLGGFLDLVFDRASGRLLDEPSIDAIFFIRQITLLFKKILLPCSTERVEKAYDKYIQCEQEVSQWEVEVDPVLLDEFDSVSSILWSLDLSRLDLLVYGGGLRPKHGPGATAERISGNAKYVFRTWTERLERFFPAAEFVIPNWGFYDELESVEFLEPGAELPVRVITVPKTLETPRIIAIEPVCMQYTQQAMMEVLVDRLEESDFLQGAIGFSDQTPNQWLAAHGSSSGSLATLDLSEASDRVSNRLVKIMTDKYRTFAGALQACRSRQADVPGRGIIPLTKFASMGSAMCFPIEAMVFLTIVMVGINRSLKRPFKERHHMSEYLSRVRVYGDDIIVPVKHVRSVIEALEDFGLKVNSHKSFWTGKFRESCGKEYYDGHDVSITRVRRVLPTSRSNVPEMISAVELRNHFYKAGLWSTAQYLDTLIERLAPFPRVSDTSPALGRFSFLPPQCQKMCKNLHRPLVKAMTIKAQPRRSVLEGHGALLKFFLKRGTNPFFDPKHLERYGRPEYVDIKIQWVPSS